MRGPVRTGAALGLALLAAGCSGTLSSIGIGSSSLKCPNVGIMQDLQAVAKFGPGPGRTDNDVAYGARMLKAEVSCDMDKKRGGLAVSTTLGISALRTRTDVRKVQLTYFVAVVDRRQTILAKRDFAIDLEFPSTQQRLEISEQHEEFIPMPKDASGPDYGVVFGFELTPEELQYNRDRASRGPG
jgi:hypothetical protein